MFRLSFVLLIALSLFHPSAASADPPALSGRIVDQSTLPLPGVQITVTSRATGTLQVIVTDQEGAFQVDLTPGGYVLTADLQGFERIDRSITMATEPVVLDLTMRLGAVTEEVSVIAAASAPVIGEARAGAPATLTREVIDTAMLPNNAFDDVLPLLPNVVRGPDGLISVAGARAPQGQLLVNGLSQNDPVLGDPEVMLPLDAIDSVQVLSHGYAAEYGRAIGGVTIVQMQSGSDRFHFSANSFDPRLHFTDAGIHGIEAWEPNLALAGPLVKGRLWVNQGLDYRFLRNRFDTVLGPQESRYHALLSWTGVDWTASAGHHVTTWLSLDPQTTDRANISAFTAASAVPALRRGGWRAAALDRVVLDSASTLESAIETAELTTRVTPEGTAPYVMRHDFTHGNYFNAQDRRASRVEANETYTRTFSARGSEHLVTIGARVAYIGYEGVNQSRRVEQHRSDGSLARVIDFAGGSRLANHGYENAVFVQDSWSLGPSVTFDTGVRYDAATIARDAVLAPRVGWTWRLGALTTLSGGAGVFADKVMLAPAAFSELQSRVVTQFGSDGMMVGSPRRFANVLNGSLRMPRADAWHLQLDRRFERGWIVRLAYQERSGWNEAVVDATRTADTLADALVLSSTGQSHARSFETTLGYRSKSKGDSVYVSYVRSSSTGNLNDFAAVEGSAKEAFVQPDRVGPLAVDVPNRLLAWGLLKLPSRVTVAPFVEIRNSFPFSAVDDEWRFAGPPNGYRFPVFASFDLVVNKIVTLPGSLPRARVGLKLFNITGAPNARDIQRDLARPDFGATYNRIPRDVRGVFELMWGGK